MSKLWEKRKAPNPIDWDECVNNKHIALNQFKQSDQAEISSSTNKLESHRLFSISEYCQIFSDSVHRLKERLESSTESNPILVWDKDDDDALNFVTAASNLRCYIFSISLKSKFETKCIYVLFHKN
jgi:ubiquitin-like 1-activating enzyme E1 B